MSRLRPYIDIFKMAWPLAIGMVNNALLEFTDRTFLAHESMASLEAALPATMLAMIVLCFFQSVVAYSGTFVAMYIGARNLRKSELSYKAGVWIALASGIAVLLAIPLGGYVFDTFSNGAEVIARQKTYFSICISGGVCLFGQMAAQAYFTAHGRTKLVLGVNIAGNLVNVLLDPVLIFGWFGMPKLGIAGAAYATVFSTMVQWAIYMIAVRRSKRTQVGAYSVSELMGIILRILRFGIPSGMYSILNCLSFTVFVFVTGMVGHVEAAVSNACFSVNYLLFAPMEGFALAASALVSRAVGAGDMVAARRAGSRTTILAVSFAAIASIVVLCLHGWILSLFASQAGADAERFFALGRILLVIMMAWQLFDAADVVLCGALRGAGDTKFVMWWMLLVSFGLWLPCAWLVLKMNGTMPALWSTLILDVLILSVGTLWRWLAGSWRHRLAKSCA